MSFTGTVSSFSNVISFSLKQFILMHITLTFWLLNFNHTMLPTHPISLRPQTPLSATANLGDSRHTLILPLPFSPSCQGYWRGKTVKTPSDIHQQISLYIPLMFFLCRKQSFLQICITGCSFQTNFWKNFRCLLYVFL